MNIRLLFTLLFFALSINRVFAQSTPVSLRSDISIQKVLNIHDGVTRMAKDPVTGNLFYATMAGDIYEVFQPTGLQAYDSLVADSNLHLVTYVQGLTFHDSVMYVSGNTTSATPLTRGVIARGVLQPNGSRVWSEVAHSDAYETADYFDHLFSGSIVNETGDSLYICSGSRGDHGEIQTRYGLYTNIRNKSLTSCILRIPLNANAMVIPDDSAALDAQQLILCRGIRNTYDFRYDGHHHLFGVENSGDRDMDDEMNWIQAGNHYGFPWQMGSTWNPQQYPGFVPANDPLINHTSTSWQQNFFSNDPTFPQLPVGFQLTLPCKNYGPDGDAFRDTVTGAILDASDLDTAIYSFTAHRSPLGLVFDTDSIFDPPYRGHGFVTCYTRGDTSISGYSTLLSPFNDIGEDILDLDMVYDSSLQNFSFHASRIASGFHHPVDQEIDSNIIYLAEVGFGNSPAIWAIEMPALTLNSGSFHGITASVYPNPGNSECHVRYQESFNGKVTLQLFDLNGRQVIQLNQIQKGNEIVFSVKDLPNGIYFGKLTSGNFAGDFKVVVVGNQ